MSLTSKFESTALHHSVFATLVLLAAAILYRPLSTLLGSALVNDAHSSVLMVLPISAAMLWSERRTVFSRVQYSTAAAFPLAFLLATCFLVRGTSRALGQEAWLSLSVLLFTGWLIAAFIFCYGAPAFSRARFPLLLLILMAPLPEGLRQRIIVWLQYGSADATSWLFRLANVPFSRSGVVLVLPRVTIEIAQECSGIRSSMVLLVTTLLLAHLFLKATWSKVALLVLLVPVTIAKNGLRIFVLAMLGMYVDSSFLTGRLHHNGGVVFFALAFACMWVLALILRRLETRRKRPHLPVHTDAPGPVLIAKNLL